MQACSAILIASLVAVSSASARNPMPNPDFTKSESIPEGATHTWNLGATGARGWMHSHRLETTAARQILVTEVASGSPAEGVLATDDVILGVAGGNFSRDPRVEFGLALTAAEAGSGELRLKVWRKGMTHNVVVKLPVLGTYSATAPYDCEKSARILAVGCKSLAGRMQEENYPRSQNAITRSLNALALLASGNPEYLPLVKREAEWAAGFSSDNFQVWWYAYVIMLLAEYQLATGDDGYKDGMRRLALEAAEGQSIVGSWGHRFAGDDGRLIGYGMMNAPGVPLTTSLIMARMAGIDEPALDLAIERSAKLIRFYIGKGAIPYGDHNPWTQTHEDNGKCGMAAVMFNLLGEPEGAEFFSRMSVASHGPERDTGHTGNFTNLLWAMPAIALSGPQATGGWMREFGAWNYDLTRSQDHRFTHPGPPDQKPDSFRSWDATGGYLLAYAMPLKKLVLTGKQPAIIPQLDTAATGSLLRDGRGWSNNNRNSAYDALDGKQLLERLGSWSPTVRERAAAAIQRRKGDKPVATLIAMLEAPDLHARYGACETLKNLRSESAPAVPALMAQLDHEDLWLRVLAAEALAHIGKAASPALPVLLERITLGPTDQDPRAMEQRYLCIAVFGQMLRDVPIEGVDFLLLHNAITAGLQNQDGRSRGVVGQIYGRLTFEQIEPMLPAIHEAIVTPAPSGIMFADGVRMAGLQLLAKHHVEAGIQAGADYVRNQNKWASEKRTPEILAIIESYGAHAQAVVPHLLESAAMFSRGEENFPGHLSAQKAQMVRDSVERIKGFTARPALRPL